MDDQMNNSDMKKKVDTGKLPVHASGLGMESISKDDAITAEAIAAGLDPDDLEMFICEYSTGDRAEISDAERAYVEAMISPDNHTPAADCARQLLNEYIALHSMFRRPTPVVVPAESIARVNAYLDKIIYSNDSTSGETLSNNPVNNSANFTRRKPKSKISDVRRNRVNLVLDIASYAFGIAAVVCLLLAAWIYTLEPILSVKKPPHPVSVTSKLITIADINREFEEAKNSGRTFDKLIEMCQEYVRANPDNDSAKNYVLLAVFAAEGSGDYEAANKIYVQYADLHGTAAYFRAISQHKETKLAEADCEITTAKIIQNRINELSSCGGGNNEMQILSLCDLLISRYPNSDAANQASYLIAVNMSNCGLHKGVIRICENIISRNKEGIWGSKAKHLIPQAVEKLSKNEALSYWDNYLKSATTTTDKAYAYWNRGILRCKWGPEFYQDALLDFLTVKHSYPESEYESIASDLANIIKNKTFDKLQFGSYDYAPS